ncbi:MAG: pyridoxal phosphate-dependent aminotransferase, partial [Pararhodobacter sp.]|nr:pyridoxal phosphate-dependent aminotransferase [Pararhodobacter sp.]
SARYSHRLGRPIGTDRFLCLPGTQTSLYLVLRALCEPGCEVLLGNPMYATYEGLIRASGATPVPVRLVPDNGFRLRAEDVAAAITPATRVLLLNTPHNPTGAILRPEDLRALGKVAQEHDLWIVSDEVYGDLTHDNRLFTSALADPAFEDRTIVAASISKSHASPGFRSGWVVGSAEFCTRALPLSETMLFGSQPFIADMTAQAVAAPPDLARAMAARMANRARIIRDALDGVAGLRVSLPEAGMFALIDISALSGDSVAFALKLLETVDVAVMPGASFGAGLEGWLRVALNASDEDTADACARIRRFAEGHAA